MSDELKHKIDKLIESGYSFDFLNSGQGLGCNVQGQIQIPFGCKDKDFTEIIDRCYGESSSLSSECRRYIQSLNK